MLCAHSDELPARSLAGQPNPTGGERCEGRLARGTIPQLSGRVNALMSLPAEASKLSKNDSVR
jgi:hypothetical protein